MKTHTQVSTGLDLISQRIAAQQNVMQGVEATAANVVAELTNITTEFADVIATIQGYSNPGPPNGAEEVLFVDQLAKRTAEFVALVDVASIVQQVISDPAKLAAAKAAIAAL